MASTTETLARTRHAAEKPGRLRRAATWALVLGLAAGAVWFGFLRGGAPPRRIEVPKMGEITGAADASKDSARSRKPEAAPVETYEVFAPKDPFRPQVETQPRPSAARSGSASTVRVGDHAVELAGILDSSSVRIRVDGSEYLVGVGETFAEFFKVVKINGRCVGFLHGDELVSLC